jgi:hypothetical protein
MDVIRWLNTFVFMIRKSTEFPEYFLHSCHGLTKCIHYRCLDDRVAREQRQKLAAGHSSSA